MNNNKIGVFVDGNSLLNRTFYAIKYLSTSTGKPTNAISGFLNIFLNIVNEIKPTHVAVAFDLKAPTFRKNMYDGYKAGRRPTPPALNKQFAYIKEILQAMDVFICEKEGYEADDILGTLANEFSGNSYIVTGDKDLLQVVSEKTKVIITKKGFTDTDNYDVAKIKEEFNLEPKQLIDVKALMGDSSDKIPGAPGIGEKKAFPMIVKYGSVENVYKNLDKLPKRICNILKENKDLVKLSYKLGEIVLNVPNDVKEKEYKFSDVYSLKAYEVLEKYELQKIIEQCKFEDAVAKEIESKNAEVKSIDITDESELKKLIKKLEKSKEIAMVFDEYIIHISDNSVLNYRVLIQKTLIDEGMFESDILQNLKKLFENKDIKHILFDIKNTMYKLDEIGVKIKGSYEDVLLQAHLCDSNKNYEDVSQVLEGELTHKAAKLFSVSKRNLELLEKLSLTNVYKNIEIPLVEVLFKMEKHGFLIDLDILEELDNYFEQKLDVTTKEIYKYSGEEFNINSPKQLAVILFEKLKLKAGKKTKTGYSTNIDVLNNLKNDHKIIAPLIYYRELQKIKSTYIDSMKKQIGSDKRIHTVFKQALTSTGRLSSTEPNLQNIPIRSAEGREIRRMFIPSENSKLLCADYSQVELRLLAHFSQDEHLVDLYKNGRDVHQITASKIYDVDVSAVDADMRRSAKAVNFGIIYGISNYGLATDLGIEVYQAKQFIETYFKSFPKVKEYINTNVAFAKENGYITSLSGRRRYIPELYSKNKNEIAFGERIAMNMPLQGSASDITKMAMNKLYRTLKNAGFKAELLLQVHDEIIVDTPKEEVEEVKSLLIDIMQNIYKLRVPLKVNVSVVDNWYDA